MKDQLLQKSIAISWTAAATAVAGLSIHGLLTSLAVIAAIVASFSAVWRNRQIVKIEEQRLEIEREQLEREFPKEN